MAHPGGGVYVPAPVPAPVVPTAPPGPRPPQRSRWLGPVIGNPIGDFEPRPPAPSLYRPDTVVDGWSTDDFTVRLGSVRGYGHRYSDDPRQDDVMAMFHDRTSAVAFAVADGVSSAKLSHIGSTMACREAVNAILDGLDRPVPEVDWQNLVARAAWQLCEQTKARFKLTEIDKDLTSREMATTLITGYVIPTEQGPQVHIVQVGDSSAWILRDGSFRAMYSGKYDSENGLVDSATTALPRVPQVRPSRGPLNPGAVLLVGTDGFGDALGDGDNAVGRHFAGALAAPGPVLKFVRDLDFSRELFDDDRTLFALWPRSRG